MLPPSLFRRVPQEFLVIIDKAAPKDLDVHLVLDNFGTRKTALIHNWLARRPRFHLHFTPTNASWINQLERWFAEITHQMIRRSSYQDTLALETTIKEYLEDYNEHLKSLIWTTDPDQM